MALDAITGSMPASLLALPENLRSGMQGIPADVLSHLTQAELQARGEYIAELQASILAINDRPTVSALIKKQQAVKQAMPFYALNVELKNLDDRYKEILRSADSSQSAADLAVGIFEAREDLQRNNPQPPGLERYLTEIDPSVPVAAGVLASAGPGGSPLAQPDDSADAPDVKTVYTRDQLGGTVSAARQPYSPPATKTGMQPDLAKAHIVGKDDELAAEWASQGLSKSAIAELVKMREKLAADAGKLRDEIAEFKRSRGI